MSEALARKPLGSVTYDAAKKRWMIAAQPHVMTRLRRVFERIPKNAVGAVPLGDTILNARELRWFIDRFPLDISDIDMARLDGKAEEHKARQKTVERMLAADYEPRSFKLAKPVRDYQRLAADLALARKALLIGDEMGLGKTISALAFLTDPSTRPALVVCPTHMPAQWAEKVAEFAPEMRVHILKRGTPYDLTIGARGKKVSFPDIIITNYFKLVGWAETLAGLVRSVVYDEVQALRHEFDQHGDVTRRYAAALHLRDNLPYRIGLSGTPVFNYGPEIRVVLTALEEDALGTRAEFGREWCGGSTGPAACVEDPAALGTYLRAEGLMIRRTRKDVGRELPKVTKVIELIPVESADFGKTMGGGVRGARAPHRRRRHRRRGSAPSGRGIRLEDAGGYRPSEGPICWRVCEDAARKRAKDRDLRLASSFLRYSPRVPRRLPPCALHGDREPHAEAGLEEGLYRGSECTRASHVKPRR